MDPGQRDSQGSYDIMHACVEFVSHADYSGERLRKLGERDAIGSELHLKNISLIIVHRKAWCRNKRVRKAVKGVLQWSGQVVAEGMERGGLK